MTEKFWPKVAPKMLAAWTWSTRVKYFVSWSTLLSVVGTAGLAIAGLPEARSTLQEWIPPAIWEWGSRYVVVVVLAFALLAVAPVMIDTGLTRLRTKSGVRNKNIELSTAAAILSRRVGHLVTKINDSVGGNRDKRYLLHTLQECCKYFKQRAIQVEGVSPDAQVEAVLFEVQLNKDGSPALLNRQVQTHATAGDFAPKISRRNSRDSGELLDGLVANRNPVFSASGPDRDSLGRAMGGAGSQYSEILIVPVHRDRKSDGCEGIYGVLMVMAEAPNTLRALDHELISTFAWLCTAAISVDSATKTAKSANVG